MWKAFRSRNFRLYYAGQGVSLIGTWMQQVAMSWLVYRLTGSSGMLGLIVFLTQIPALVLSPVLGVFIDRYPLKKIILLTQAAALVQAALIAYLTLTGQATIPAIAVLSLVFGIINAMDMPVRQAFMIELVEERELLPNALALQAALVNTARLVGPAIAGILISVIGEGWCFGLNAASYCFVLIALGLTRVQPHQASSAVKSLRQEFISGFRYLRTEKAISTVILLVASMTLVGSSFLVIMPVFTDRVLHSGSGTLGLLLGASGAGALVGALLLARRKNLKTLHRSMWFSTLALGIFLVGLAFASVPVIAFLFMVSTGFFLVNINAGANLYLQSAVRDDMRGRVMSMFSLAFLGIPALGGLLAGYLSEALGVATAVALLGGATVICALLFWGRIRPVAAD